MNDNTNDNGFKRRITIRKITVGWGVYSDDRYTGYYSHDRNEAEEMGRSYAYRNGDTWIGVQEG